MNASNLVEHPAGQAVPSAETLLLTHREYARALATDIARRLPRYVDFDDLLGYAALGLAQAAREYSASRGIAFASFAYHRIRGAMYDGIRKMTWFSPALRREMARQRNSSAAAAVDAEPTAVKRRRRTARACAVVLASQHAPEERDGDDGSAQASVPVREDHHDAVEMRELLVKLRHAIDALPTGQGAVVKSLYFDGRSMADTARVLGCDKSTISRRHARALARLRRRVLGNPSNREKLIEELAGRLAVDFQRDGVSDQVRADEVKLAQPDLRGEAGSGVLAG
jgi:RNA polymerase sigma factor FliA